MDTCMAKRNCSIQQWEAIIQDRNNTNLTMGGYCKQNGLSHNFFFIVFFKLFVSYLHDTTQRRLI